MCGQPWPRVCSMSSGRRSYPYPASTFHHARQASGSESTSVPSQSKTTAAGATSVAREVADVLVERGDDLLGERRPRVGDAREEVLGARAVAGLAEDLPLEGALSGFARGELDVRGREELARVHERAEVDVLVGDLGHVAGPDRLARVPVRRADGQHEVEAARAQERGVQLAHEVRRAHEQVLGRLAHARDLAQELVR